MAIHESSVNFQNLIRDLAEMYPYDVSVVVLVELVANSLDARATHIAIDFDSKNRVLTVTDNGKGMSESDFDEYHDFAAGLKVRGTSIGFAGVGAKVSFNIADRVVTETRSDSFAGGSTWHLQTKRLLWENIDSPHLSENGTMVQVYFRPKERLSYSAPDDIVTLLRRHYLPLMDSKFLDMYSSLGYYSKELRFVINGRTIAPSKTVTDLSLDNVREISPSRAGKRYGYGVFGLAAKEYPVAPDVCGVLLCTYGKVVKADLFGQFPGNLGPRVFGVVEVPGFVNFLTTSKTDFVRKGMPGEFEKIYGPVREHFKAWLAELGVETTQSSDARQDALKLERELKKLLDDLPELTRFFGFRAPKNVLRQQDSGSDLTSPEEGIDETAPVGQGNGGEGAGLPDTGVEPGEALRPDQEAGTQKASPISRGGKSGPKVTIADRPDMPDLAWVEGNNVFINSAHACYVKSGPNPAVRRIHCLYSIAAAVQRFLIKEGNAADLLFIDRMMAAWGNK